MIQNDASWWFSEEVSVQSRRKSDTVVVVVVVCAASLFQTLVSKESKIANLPCLINFSQFIFMNFRRIDDKQCIKLNGNFMFILWETSSEEPLLTLTFFVDYFNA